MKQLALIILTSILSNTVMAYNLHIAKENYWEVDNSEFPLKQWINYCNSDPAMVIKKKIVAINPKTGETIEMEGDGICTWIHPSTKEEYAFYYSSGRITLGTDDIQINKAKEIAAKLGLKVYGDEAEEY